MSHSAKTIGNMNGPWAKLLKVGLVFVPIFAVSITGYLTWLTREVLAQSQFRESGGYATPKEVAAVKEELKDEIAKLPSEDWKRRIIRVEEKTDQIFQVVSRMEGARQSR